MTFHTAPGIGGFGKPSRRLTIAIRATMPQATINLLEKVPLL